MAKKKAAKKRIATRPLSQHDWRNGPRKPAEVRRTATIAIRVTIEERAAMNAAAKAAGRTLVDYILDRTVR